MSNPSTETRFAFGENWKNFLGKLDNQRIAIARQSVIELTGQNNLRGKTFLDIGCGSGLFSLAAMDLGATVRSFDYDPDSVACAEYLKNQYWTPEKASWQISRGDALSEPFMSELGKFDIVYSWGVLHHTGAMWRGIDLASKALKPGGMLCIAIYNDQGIVSRLWTAIKYSYCKLPSPLKPVILWPCAAVLWGPQILLDLCRLRPFSSWRRYQEERGMSPWHDVVDWVGGYPFEVASIEAINRFLAERGLEQIYCKSKGRKMGCNEFRFQHPATKKI